MTGEISPLMASLVEANAAYTADTASSLIAGIEEQRDEALAEVARLQAILHRVRMVQCWTNEDGQRFVFASDLTAALGDI